MAELSLFKRKTLNKLGVPILTYYVKYTDLETGRIRTRSTGCRNRGDAMKFLRSFNPKNRSTIDLHTLRYHTLEYAMTARYYQESLKEKAKGLVI